MATTGTLNNKPAVVRRVTSDNDKNTMTFIGVTNGQLDTPDKYYTTSTVQSKINVTLGGITSIAKVGGKRDFTVLKTIKDYNRTGAGSTRVLDQYGRVLVIDGTDIKVEKTATGQPKFVTTATTLTADNAPGNLAYADNKGLTYYVKMTPKVAVTTLTVGDELAS